MKLMSILRAIPQSFTCGQLALFAIVIFALGLFVLIERLPPQPPPPPPLVVNLNIDDFSVPYEFMSQLNDEKVQKEYCSVSSTLKAGNGVSSVFEATCGNLSITLANFSTPFRLKVTTPVDPRSRILGKYQVNINDVALGSDPHAVLAAAAKKPYSNFGEIKDEAGHPKGFGWGHYGMNSHQYAIEWELDIQDRIKSIDATNNEFALNIHQ